MESISDLITLRNVLIAASILLMIWLIRLLVKKEYGKFLNILIIIFVIFLAVAFIQSKDKRGVILSKIKSWFSSEKEPIDYSYQIKHEKKGSMKLTVYIFNEPRPKLSLSMGSRGKGLHITDISEVNAVLEYLELPKVTSGVPELSTVTGTELDANFYRWENYSDGILILERTMCKDKSKLTFHHCIYTLTVAKRGTRN